MKESILLSVKKILNIGEDYKAFDQDVLMHINSVLSILYQLGVGDKPFKIKGESETWEDFISDEENIEEVRTYVCLRVRLMFDPPQSSAVITSYENMIKELEWRLNVEVDNEVYYGICEP